MFLHDTTKLKRKRAQVFKLMMQAKDAWKDKQYIQGNILRDKALGIYPRAYFYL